MILSEGRLVLADTSPAFGRVQYFTPGGIGLNQQFASYAAIYRKQLWVNVVVDKLALGTARLPLKVYERDDNGDRSEARDSDYARLMREPNPKHDKFFFWLWTASTKEVYGEALWVKIRDAAGIPRELWPLHPINIFTEDDHDGLTYYVTPNRQAAPVLAIPERDIVHFKTYNPDTTVRGMSKIEPLRQTLLNEDAARRATSAFWLAGARPAMALKSKHKLSDAAKLSLKKSWNAVAAGADNTGATVVLEEGMEAETLSLTAEEAQYIETRKLNREEVCGAYDIPPPVVHILDRATFSNITEQMRSMYRDTQAPRLGSYESVLDKHLRPDFDPKGRQYAEFLLDEVLRGDFEGRADAQQKAVNSGQRTPNECRALDNLPGLPGGDRLFINSTMIPIDEVSVRASSTAPATLPADPAAPPKAFDRWVAAKVADRASRAATLDDVDAAVLTAGLNGSTDAVLALLAQSKAAGDDVPKFCALVWALAGGNR